MTDDLSPENRALDHAANEWADAFYNAVQWIKNLRDGIGAASFEEALANLEKCASHCQETWAAARSEALADTKDESVAQVIELLLGALMTQKHFVLRCAQKLYGRAASNASSWASNADAPWRTGKDFLATLAAAPPSPQPDELAAKDAEIARLIERQGELALEADTAQVARQNAVYRMQAAEAQRDALLEAMRSILALPYPKAKDVRHPVDVIAILARARIIARDACRGSRS